MNPDVQARAAELRRDRVPHVHARVVRAERPTSAKPGDEAVVLPDGTIVGFVGGECATATVRAQSLSLLDSGESLLLRISPEGEPGPSGETREDTLTVVNPCLSGGTLEIFLEPVIPSPTIAVFGDSPIAAALVALAGHVGFSVADPPGTALSVDRPGEAPTGTEPAESTGAIPFGGAAVSGGPGGSAGPVDPSVVAVVVASHGRDEEPVLEAAVRAGVPYVGLVASRKRGEAVVASLDLDDAERARIHTPAGLDIGARTPREVALSILAEMVSLRPRPTGRPLPAPGSTEAARHQAWLDHTPEAGEAGAGSTARAGAADRTGTGGIGGADDAAVTAAGDTARAGAAGLRPQVAVDPVCGMSVVADDTALHLDHGGIRYWFCGTGCLRAFAADPSAYLPSS